MIKKTFIALGAVVAIGVIGIIIFLVSTQSGIYRTYVQVEKPVVIFISPTDPHAVAKYALISYFRKDPSICERLERPYKPLLPEEDIGSQRDMCRGETKDMQMLTETFSTKNSAYCGEQYAFHSEGPTSDFLTNSQGGYAFIHKACGKIAAAEDLDSALQAYFAFIPSISNSHCDSAPGRRRDICHQYAESTDRLIQLYHLLEQNPDSITL